MAITKNTFYQLIKNFEFRDLFNQLGWDNVNLNYTVKADETIYTVNAVSQKRSFVVFHCIADNYGKLPVKTARRKIHRELAKKHFENLIIFTDQNKDRQIWHLSRREPNKSIITREITWYSHQQPELLYQKFNTLFISFEEEETISLVDVQQRVSASFNANAEKVTKKFYDRFKKEHSLFLKFIEGIDKVIDQEWYASLMLNRLMFIYFIQKKGFLDQNQDYLRIKLNTVKQQRGRDQFYSFYKTFLVRLFHEGLGKAQHSPELEKLIGRIPYLNGGLFDVHEIENKYLEIQIRDEAFENIFAFFDEFEWHLDTREQVGGDEVNPDVIGYIFEKYINDRAAMGAYYTKEDITEYISKNTIIPFVFDQVKKECKTAFDDNSDLWQMLDNNPDKYIYAAVQHGCKAGLAEDYSSLNIIERVKAGLPENIAIGVDTEIPNLLERRQDWNGKAPEEIALPTEIYREVIERRTHYWELRDKITRGEIRQINDFITYNLDIRQFVQDAVEQYPGADFINAMYKAQSTVTILDPTCGSGAFLFAALNILEPLYEACIERMEEFVDRTGSQKHKRFATVLNDIAKHPNRTYFIYKSIILNNLYGVDIMKEAVEIAKLRLFLKLVATVDVDYSKENLGLEPLPDIDFNIRAGNTLVGFTQLEDVNDALKQTRDLFAGKHIEKIKEEAEYVNMAYRAFRATSIDNDDTQKEVKNELSKKLNSLNEKLHIFLAHQYGIDSQKKSEKFKEWQENHKPFHWFSEFYDIVNEKNGFDIIIGNPPYVEYSKVKKMYNIRSSSVLECGNIYAFIIERCLTLNNNFSRNGMIVQNSIVSTKRMSKIQNLIINSGNLYFCNFDDRPAKLFTGINHMKGTVFITVPAKKNISTYSTKFYRWHDEFRENVFNNINYIEISSDVFFDGLIPKISNNLHLNIHKKIYTKKPISHLLKSNGSIVYCHRIASYFIKAIDFIPYFYNDLHGQKKSDDYKTYYVDCDDKKYILVSVLNSSTFYLYWHTMHDGYHCGKQNIEEFPFSLNSNDDYLILLGKNISSDYKKNSFRKETTYKNTGLVIYDEFYPKKSKIIIDKIDNELTKIYGLNEEELDFIINYDIKYRMGKELENLED